MTALFYMWDRYRRSLVEGHRFYVEQARKRLLGQFDDIEAEANKAAEEWLNRQGECFDPDRHDPDALYEASWDVASEWYCSLSEMREQIVLSVVAGMYHEWDKKLRGWLVKEIRHWHGGQSIRSAIWFAPLPKVIDLLESFGWRLRDAAYFNKLDACRLVVNVYKHGDGGSLDDLRESYPEYLQDSRGASDHAKLFRALRDYTDLRVTDQQLTDFSRAVEAFWNDVPEYVYESQMANVPKWFTDALESDARRDAPREARGAAP